MLHACLSLAANLGLYNHPTERALKPCDAVIIPEADTDTDQETDSKPSLRFWKRFYVFSCTEMITVSHEIVAVALSIMGVKDEPEVAFTSNDVNDVIRLSLARWRQWS